MRFGLADTTPQRAQCNLLALPVPEPGTLSAAAAEVDAATGGRLAEQARAEGFTGKQGTTVMHVAPDAPFRRVLLVGTGAGSDQERLRRYAAVAIRRAGEVRAVRVALDAGTPASDAAERIRAVAEGAGLGAYRFDKYRSDASAPIQEATVLAPGGDARALAAALRLAEAAVRATCLARDLVNEPANVMTPAALADVAREVAERDGFRCRVIELDEARRMGMGLFAAVAGASDQPAKFIVLDYAPAHRAGRSGEADRTPRTVALVGKGITFDSGGLDIKGASGMATMKGDMGGAAAVVGAMSALRAHDVPVRVLGIAAATENMISGHALRPGDIIRSLAGKTVEITNTDAEGRLVLADGITFAQREGATELIDLATLTGSCVIALGDYTAGLMGNDQTLQDRLRRAAALAGEQVWQLPMYEEYLEAMRGQLSDLKNSAGRQAGAERAAAFIGEFARGTPWAHLDIAGPSFCEERGAPPYMPMGGTGFGVRTLLRYLASPD
jgi:leucyl aminopeptidase